MSREITNVAEYLRAVAERLEQHAESDLQPLLTQIDMASAYQRLASVLDNIRIEVSLIRHGDSPPHVEYRIWDGTRFCTAPTLTGCVNAVLDAQRCSQRTDPVAALAETLHPIPF